MNRPAQFHGTIASVNSITRRRFVALAAGTASLAVAPVSRGRAQAANVIKIGHIQPLTGPSAAYGIRARDGAIIAVEEINAAGGWTDADGQEVSDRDGVGDMANDPKQAITLVSAIRHGRADDRVLGPTQLGRLCAAGAGRGTDQAAPRSATARARRSRSGIPYAFRVNPVSTRRGPDPAAEGRRARKVKRLAVIYDQTQDAQARRRRSLQGARRASSATKSSAFEAFRAGDQDFSPQIAKIRSLRPGCHLRCGRDRRRHQGRLADPRSRHRQALITGFGSFQDPVYWDGTQGAASRATTPGWRRT